MATNNKTVGKTTKKLMKGGNNMTIKDALLYTLKDANDYNNYRKDNKKSYTLISKIEYAQATKKILSNENLKELTQAWLVIRKYQDRLRKEVLHQRELDRVYGKQEVHPSEVNNINDKQQIEEAREIESRADLEQSIIDNM